MPHGLNPRTVEKMADAALTMANRLRATPEGREKIAQEVNRMRREAQEKGAT